MSSEVDKPDPKARMPRQIPYIIASEGCERFSFYGMRNILYDFFTLTMLVKVIPEAAQRGSEAKHIQHTFMMGVYFFPLLGGWLADRFFGKFKTIIAFSLVYCAGHGMLALSEDSLTGFKVGLFMIALGAGGIKPLVASFVGDQFDDSNKHLAKKVFDAFYWIINFGSFFASLFMPRILSDLGPSIAFGIPGILMFIATAVLWMARAQYVRVPIKAADPDSFSNVAKTALLAPGPNGRPGLLVAVLGAVLSACSFLLYAFDILPIVEVLCLTLVGVLAFGGWGTSMQLERARGKHSDAAVDGVRAVLRILIVFALVTPFHSLFDQKATEWIAQGNDMIKPEGWKASQMQIFNPALVMILIPFNNFVLYPWLRRKGWEPTSLRRMTWGIAFSGLAWIVIGTMQLVMDAGTPLQIWWQILPYAILTLGEVLVSATGLEFAYSQAPLAMKGVIMSFWNLTTTVGNLWVLLSNSAIRNPTVQSSIDSTGISQTAFLMFFFAAFALIAAIVFALYTRRYTMRDNYRSVGTGTKGGRDSAAEAATGKQVPLPTATARDKSDS